MKSMANYKTHFFLGVRSDSTYLDTALDQVKRYVEKPISRQAKVVFFTNVHSIYMAHHHQQLQRCINDADMVLPDGSGLKIAGKMLNRPILENLNGTDFTPELCELAEQRGWSIYLLGAEQKVVEQCSQRLDQRFPDLEIAGYHDGFFDAEEEDRIINQINRLKPDILLVAMGTPLQEQWLSNNARRLEVKVGFAVGGLFDFLAGKFDRAPLWMRQVGIEWIHRLLQNPSDKWKRVFVEIPYFLSSVTHRATQPNKIRTHLSRY